MKNIALFIDGTWNEPIRGETNVYKLFAASEENAGQDKKYLSGVGTVRETPDEKEEEDKPQWFSRSSAFIAAMRAQEKKVLAGIGGWGIGDLIKEAYQYLSSRYDERDRIYLFGFSRGALAARSLAGFADAVGLLLRGNARIEHVAQAYKLYEQGKDASQSPLREFLRKITGSSGPGPEGPLVLPIYLIGLWDTVATLGLPGRVGGFFTAPYTEFHKTDLPANVTHARHALALHELRNIFEPLLWLGHSPENPNQIIKQVWFTGAHADVGGGYPEKESAWSNIALKWMAREATNLGLKLNAPLVIPEAAGVEPIHHEISGVFGKCTPTQRHALSNRKKLDPETIQTYSVHESVRARLVRPEALRYAFNAEISKVLKAIDDSSFQLSLEFPADPEEET